MADDVFSSFFREFSIHIVFLFSTLFSYPYMLFTFPVDFPNQNSMVYLVLGLMSICVFFSGCKQNNYNKLQQNQKVSRDE